MATVAKQKITPCLWFDDDAEEAARHYVSIFKKSKILEVTKYGDAGPGRKGSVMTVTFQIEGQPFLALNGGPHFKFNEAISLHVSCKSQAEIDRLWKKLAAGGEIQQCGWLKDKFGLSWQIIPEIVSQLLQEKDPERSRRGMQAMLRMRKLDIGELKKALAGPA